MSEELRKACGEHGESDSKAQLDALRSEVAFLKAFADPPDMKTGKTTRDELRELLQEAVDGFGRVLISTSDQKGVYGWVRRVRKYLASNAKLSGGPTPKDNGEKP